MEVQQKYPGMSSGEEKYMWNTQLLKTKYPLFR
jgi:hypothetical protein